MKKEIMKNNITKYLISGNQQNFDSFVSSDFNITNFDNIAFRSRNCLMSLKEQSSYNFYFRLHKDAYILHSDFKTPEKQTEWWLEFIKSSYCDKFNAEVMGSNKDYVYVSILGRSDLNVMTRFANYELLRHLTGYYNNNMPALIRELSTNYKDMFENNNEVFSLAVFLTYLKNNLNTFPNYNILTSSILKGNKYSLVIPNIVNFNNFKCRDGVQMNFVGSKEYIDQTNNINSYRDTIFKTFLPNKESLDFIDFIKTIDLSDDLNVRNCFTFLKTILNVKNLKLDDFKKIFDNKQIIELKEEPKPILKTKRKYVRKQQEV